MRIAWDGLPSDLPLSRAERRDLRTRIRRGRRGPPPPAVPGAVFVPAGMMLLTTMVWMPTIWLWQSPWRWAVVAVCLLVQIAASWWLMKRLIWPHTCRLMAAAGYEVCLRCAFPLGQVPRDPAVCPECGCDRPPMAAV